MGIYRDISQIVVNKIQLLDRCFDTTDVMVCVHVCVKIYIIYTHTLLTTGGGVF